MQSNQIFIIFTFFLFNYILWGILADDVYDNICRNETHEVIKYLEYSVHRLHNEDPGVHNLLLSLYAKQVASINFLFFTQKKKKRKQVVNVL